MSVMERQNVGPEDFHNQKLPLVTNNLDPGYRKCKLVPCAKESTKAAVRSKTAPMRSLRATYCPAILHP